MSPEARAARERRQKIFVVVGGILLLGLLAIQLPKLLGGSGGSETASAQTTAGGAISSASAAASAASSAPAVTGTPTPSATVAAVAARSAVPTSDKLSAFGVFKQKDPFVQQVVTSDATGVGTAPPAGASAGTKTKKESGAAQKFSVGTKPATAATVTVLSVNGDRQALEAGSRFPSSDPVFVLVAEHPASKSVVIGVVGGAYSGGSKTTKLVQGKPLTLVNTATGAKYRIVLVAVGNGSGGSPKQPAATKTK
jgi:hypothetical protein